MDVKLTGMLASTFWVLGVTFYPDGICLDHIIHFASRQSHVSTFVRIVSGPENIIPRTSDMNYVALLA